MRYNTMCDVAFEIRHDCENPRHVPVSVLISGLERRLAYLKENPEEAREAFGILDTMEEEDVDAPIEDA